MIQSLNLGILVHFRHFRHLVSGISVHFRHFRHFSSSCSGMAYLAILILLAFLSTMAFAFLFKTATFTSATMSRSNGLRAEYLAEAAANHALWRLQ